MEGKREDTEGMEAGGGGGVGEGRGREGKSRKRERRERRSETHRERAKGERETPTPASRGPGQREGTPRRLSGGRAGGGGAAATPPPRARLSARYFYRCAHRPPLLPLLAAHSAAPGAARASRAASAARDRSRAPGPTDRPRHGPQGPQEDPVLRARAPQPAGPPPGGDGKGAAPHPRRRPHAPRPPCAPGAAGSTPAWRNRGDGESRAVSTRRGSAQSSLETRATFSRGLHPDPRAREFQEMGA